MIQVMAAHPPPLDGIPLGHGPRSQRDDSPRRGSPSPSFQDALRRRGSVSSQRSLAACSSPTASNSSYDLKRSTPPVSQVFGPSSKSKHTPPTTHTSRNGTPERHAPPTHPSDGPTAHAQAQPFVGFPRMANRPFTPTRLSIENFQMTPELLAEIGRAHDLGASGAAGVAYAGGASSSPNGTTGVAYAGGITSNSVRIDSAPPRGSVAGNKENSHEPAMVPVSAQSVVQRQEHIQRDADWDHNAQLQRRGSSNRPAMSQAPPAHSAVTPGRESPQYHTPLSTPLLGPTQSPTERPSYFSQTQPAQSQVYSTSGAASRASLDMQQSDSPARLTPPALAKVYRQTPPTLAAKTRTPDKSLPVQEEQEDDIPVNHDEDISQLQAREEMGLRSLFSPLPMPAREFQSVMVLESRDLPARRDGHVTSEHLVPPPKPDGNARDGGAKSQDEGSGTPRLSGVTSPRIIPTSKDLKQPPPIQPLPRAKPRNGSTDQLGMRTLDATVFEPTSVPLNAPRARPPLSQRLDSRASYYSTASSAQPTQYYDAPDGHGHFLDDPAAAYYRNFAHSPLPVPPTPHVPTAVPSPLLSGMHPSNGSKPFIPPFSPAPPVGSPYPYPYGHIRRGQTYNPSHAGTMDMQYDPSVIREQMALQMQIYAMNNGMVSDSTLSPSSTPFPGPAYNPWTYLQTSRVYGARPHTGYSTASMRSSPSHEPLPLPKMPTRPVALHHRGRSGNLRKQGSNGKVPPRIPSTQPRDTSPELSGSSSGEETAGQSMADGSSTWIAEDSSDKDREWIDEEDAGEDGDDLLQLEFHPNYIANSDKRRRRWNARWEALVREFNALDRETDTTMVLMASPPHSNKMHCVASRAIRRDMSVPTSTGMNAIRTAFGKVASDRDAARSRVSSLVERLSRASAASSDGAPSETTEADLRTALDTALHSLSALGLIYEEREMRWGEEMRRLDEDRDRVNMLLSQVLGVPMTRS